MDYSKLEEFIQDIKMKLKVKAQRLRRYKKCQRQFYQNKLFRDYRGHSVEQRTFCWQKENTTEHVKNENQHFLKMMRTDRFIFKKVLCLLMGIVSNVFS